MNIKKEILEIVNKIGSVSYKELANRLGIKQKTVGKHIKELVDSYELGQTKNGKIVPAETLGYYKGILETKPAGFAFLRGDMPVDIFVPAKHKCGAMNGETVIVKRNWKRNRGQNPEGRVVKILSPLDIKLVGTAEVHKKLVFVKPDYGVNEDIFIPPDAAKKVKNGQKVMVNLTRRAGKNKGPMGEIIEVLGKEGAPGVDILACARRYGLVAEFDKACEEKAATLKKKPSAKNRLDLRKKTVITIDGADAKDLDDAISIEKLEGGLTRLGVHIADVSHYVKQGDVLDEEAKRRGTSVYLVDRVIPMLPKALSNDLCSLNPGEDKYTLSCIMDFDKKGELKHYKLANSIVKTRRRMTYDDVNNILKGNRKLRTKYSDIVSDLKDMNSLAKVLRKRRFKRGSIDFDLNEAEIRLDKNGLACEVSVRERGDAHKLIEELMLKCNVTVAQHFYKMEMPFIYRVHEQPDADKMRELAIFLKNFSIKLKGVEDIKPKAIQDVLSEVEGRPEANAVNSVTLRSLKKAEYLTKPVEHFGLAEEQYCHFTSPIRRYPDLIVHRLIKLWLAGKLTPRKIAMLNKDLPGIAKHSSERERNAIEAERAVNDIKMAEYMSSRLGEEYKGIISGVTRFGIFVELENTIEGMVPLGSISDDYYIFNEQQYSVCGEKTKKTFALGDNAYVKVVSADISTGRIEFEMLE